MDTQTFLDLLKEHSDKALYFEYDAGRMVATPYHITEVKNITFDTVDCGAGTDFWKETWVQLWENPQEIGSGPAMSAYKASGILGKVDRTKPMVRDAELRIEYGNPHFHAASLGIGAVDVHGDRIVFRLVHGRTDCKAKETCGVVPAGATAAQDGDAAACAPGSGCC